MIPSIARLVSLVLVSSILALIQAAEFTNSFDGIVGDGTTVTTAINGEVSTVTVAERLVTGSSVEEPATLSLHPLSLVSIERKIHAGTGFSYTYPTRYLDSAGTATGSYANPTGYTNGSYSSYTNGSYSGYTNGSYSGYTNGSYSGYSVKALSPVETQSGLLRISRAARFAANWKMLAMVTAGGCGWMSL